MSGYLDSPGGLLKPATQAKASRRAPKAGAVQADSRPHAGAPCPRCALGRLDYDGLLNLSCDRCGYSLVGGVCT